VRQLASTYNVGIARNAIKDNQAAVEAEIGKHEDLSRDKWKTAAELEKLIERHPLPSHPRTSTSTTLATVRRCPSESA
jgi:hypothetical protein